MPRPSLDEYYAAMIPLIASRGTCPRRKVGAVLVDERGRLVSCGYNGPAAGRPHCDDSPCPGAPGQNGARDACVALHAEANAVMQAADSRRRAWTLYCTLTPCFPCAKLMLAAGVREVVALQAYAHDDTGPRLLVSAGVPVWIFNEGRRIPWEGK